MTADTDTPLRVIQGGLSQKAEDQKVESLEIDAEQAGVEQTRVEQTGTTDTAVIETSDIESAEEQAFALRSDEQVALPRLITLRQQREQEHETQAAPKSETLSTETEAEENSEKLEQGDQQDSTLTPLQKEFPFALVQGELVTEIPSDLYIPPAALEVFLEAFEGPLDLLLYLIKRQNLDILEIDVAQLTEQYMQYVRLMDSMQFELAAEYLVMAATLTEIKSRMLLPRSQEIDEDDDDPRAQLIKRLQEYERFKQAAEDIDELPREERDVFVADITPPVDDRPAQLPDVNLKELLVALGDVLHRADMFESHHVSMEPLSTRERMGNILDLLGSGSQAANSENFYSFDTFFKPEEGRGGVVVTFLAIMQLIKETMIEIVQAEAFAPIYVRARTAEPAETPEASVGDSFDEGADELASEVEEQAKSES